MSSWALLSTPPLWTCGKSHPLPVPWCVTITLTNTQSHAHTHTHMHNAHTTHTHIHTNAHTHKHIPHRGVGCIFVEMLTGKPLFPGIKGPVDQLNKIWQVTALPTPSSPPSSIPPSFPPLSLPPAPLLSPLLPPSISPSLSDKLLTLGSHYTPRNTPVHKCAHVYVCVWVWVRVHHMYGFAPLAIPMSGVLCLHLAV